MIERSRWTLRSAIVALTFVTLSQAQASESGRTLSEVRSDHASYTATDSLSETHAEHPMIAANDRKGADIIEEVVVVGNRKKNRLTPDRFSTTRPAFERLGRFELRLLPVYEPEEANRQFRLARIDERLRDVGTVTLFRLRFGR